MHSQISHEAHVPVIEHYPHSHPGTHSGTRQRYDPLLINSRKPKDQTLIRSYNLRMKQTFCEGEKTSLQDSALLLTLMSLRKKGSPGGSLEDLADTLVGARRALKVLVSTDLLANLLTLIAY